MRSIAIICLCLAAATATLAAPTLVPRPASFQLVPRWEDPISTFKTVIVLGDQADDADRAAAEMLARRAQRAHKAQWPIVAGSQEPGEADVQVVIGRPQTSRRVADLCKEAKIDFAPAIEGTDAYAIQVFPPDTLGKPVVVLLTGVNGRAVTYAQDAFFQLIEGGHEGGELWLANIRDQASIPWRGRPQTQVAHHLQPGIWDLYVSSRLNWIDLRNGTYAFEPDYRFTDKDKADIATVITEAHRRGMLVYGTVNCAVPRSMHEQVMAMFRQFIAFGVDGLWISFDDKGPGEAPEVITAAVLALGREHNMTGPRIATTPPKGSYQTVTAPFNRKIVAVPGMDKALWFWTPLPSDQMLADAKAIGMTEKASWWHNWPRESGGFSHLYGRGLSADGVGSYTDVPDLSVGWHRPTYEDLADAAKFVQAVVPWGGNEWPQAYIAPSFGWWAWAPERFDWSAARDRIYRVAFGPVDARKVDDSLEEAKSLFVYGMNAGPWRPICPARLKKLENREKALRALGICELMLNDIRRQSPGHTLLEPGHLEARLIAPMAQEFAAGKACAAAEYPEYWWNAHQYELLAAIHAGQDDQAAKLIAAGKAKAGPAVEAIGRDMTMLKITPDYVAFWTRWVNMSPADWKGVLAERQAALKKRIADYSYFSVVVDKLLKSGAEVPTGYGRGGAERQMRILATAIPEAKEQFWGDWLAGLHREHGQTFAAFAMEPNAAARGGDYAELPVTLNLPAERRRLGLLLYMARWTKDSLGLEEVAGRWAGYTTVELLWGDRVLWQGDVGLPRAGCEWEMVGLPELPRELTSLPLRLRVTDNRDSSGMRAIVFVGPIRLIKLPG